MLYKLSKENVEAIDEMINRAHLAMAQVEFYSQEQLDRLCQAIGWYTSNEPNFTYLAQLGVDESGIGDRAGRPAKRFKIHGVLRDALRQKSTGIVEEDLAKGLIKYAKPAGVIASLIPMTNPALTPPVTGIYAAKARDAVIFSPHPRTKGTTTAMVDLTADIKIAAQNTRMSKTSDFGSGCSADGNIIIQTSIFKTMVQALIAEGGYLCSEAEKSALEAVMWDEKGNRTFATIACPPQQTAQAAGFTIPADRKFLMVNNQDQIGAQHKFCKEKLTTLMALYHFDSFDHALKIVSAIYSVGGKGHSCGIYSHNDDHIDALARIAPVSRIMVRQAQSKANAGAFTNGMPMTSSLGCGVWGGNITNENVSLKHFMNYTWVSRPIAEDRPSERELFGEFYSQEGTQNEH